MRYIKTSGEKLVDVITEPADRQSSMKISLFYDITLADKNPSSRNLKEIFKLELGKRFNPSSRDSRIVCLQMGIAPARDMILLLGV